MLTSTDMSHILARADRFNLNGAKQGQAIVWHQALIRLHAEGKCPDISRELAEEAVDALAVARTAEKRDTWITPGDLLAAVKMIRSQRIHDDRQENGALEPPRALDDHPRRAIEWRRRVHARIGSGMSRAMAVERVNEAAGVAAGEEVRLIELPSDFRERMSAVTQDA